MTQESINEKENAIVEEVLGIDIEPEAPAEEEIVVVDEPKKETAKEEEKPDFRRDGNIDKKINNRVDARFNRLEKSLTKKLEADREAYMGAIETVTARVQEALDRNDLKAYAQANQALEKLETKKEEIETEIKEVKKASDEEIEERVEEAKAEPRKEEPKKEVKLEESATRWLQTNKEFVDRIDNDAEFSAVSKAIAQKLLKNGYKDRPQIDLLVEVKKQMLQKMPEEFADLVKAKDELPNVSGGKMDMNTGKSGGSVNGKTYSMSDVPALDRQIIKNLVHQKVYKDEKEAVTKYFQRKLKEQR